MTAEAGLVSILPSFCPPDLLPFSSAHTLLLESPSLSADFPRPRDLGLLSG